MLKAALEHPKRRLRLLVVADPVTEILDVELLGDGAHAAGVGPFSCDDGRSAGTCTLTASCKLTVIDPVEIRDDIEVSLAITWARQLRGDGVDLAGTALVFWPGERQPIEFQSVRDDPFNQPGPTAPVAPLHDHGGVLAGIARALGRRHGAPADALLPGRATTRR